MRTYKIIANPAAGRGRSRAIVLKVVELLKQKGVQFDLELTRSPGDAANIARNALSSFDVIVVVGGDGTVNEVLPGMLFSQTPLGIIPGGSGNDLIKSLSIPANMEKAVDVLLQGKTRSVDVGKINTRYFANNVGFGFDAAVNKASYSINNAKQGLRLYLCALFRTLGRYDPVRLKLFMDHSSIEQDLFLVSIGNGTTCGGGFRLTPHAKVDDGLLDVTIVRPLSIPTLLWHLPKVFLGTFDRVSYATMLRTTKITIESIGTVPIHVDGESFAGDAGHYEIEVLPRALTIIGDFPET